MSLHLPPGKSLTWVSVREPVTCYSHLDTGSTRGPRCDVNNINRRSGRKGKEGIREELGHSGKVWRKVALTRVNPAIVTHAPSPHNVHIRIIERLTWSVSGRGWTLFLPKMRVPAPGREFPRTPATTANGRLFLDHSQSPRGRQRDAHTRFGRLGSRILQACARTKLGKLRKTLPLLFSDSIVFVFVLGRRRHSLCGRCLASRLSYPTLFLLARSVSIGRPNHWGPARQLNAQGIAWYLLPRGWSLPTTTTTTTVATTTSRNPLSYIPVESYARLRSRGVMLCIIRRSTWSPISDNDQSGQTRVLRAVLLTNSYYSTESCYSNIAMSILFSIAISQD